MSAYPRIKIVYVSDNMSRPWGLGFRFAVFVHLCVSLGGSQPSLGLSSCVLRGSGLWGGVLKWAWGQGGVLRTG